MEITWYLTITIFRTFVHNFYMASHQFLVAADSLAKVFSQNDFSDNPEIDLDYNGYNSVSFQGLWNPFRLSFILLMGTEQISNGLHAF